MLLVTRALVGLDRAVEEVEVAVLYAGERSLHGNKSCPQGFDLRAFQLNASLEFLENTVVSEGLPVCCDFGGHGCGLRAAKSRLDRLSQLWRNDHLALGDFLKRDIREARARIDVDEWTAPGVELAHTA